LSRADRLSSGSTRLQADDFWFDRYIADSSLPCRRDGLDVHGSRDQGVGPDAPLSPAGRLLRGAHHQARWIRRAVWTEHSERTRQDTRNYDGGREEDLSAPPSMHAKQPRSTSTVSRISPPSRTRSQRLFGTSRTRQRSRRRCRFPSGMSCLRSAHSLRFLRLASAAISKAVSLLP